MIAIPILDVDGIRQFGHDDVEGSIGLVHFGLPDLLAVYCPRKCKHFVYFHGL